MSNQVTLLRIEIKFRDYRRVMIGIYDNQPSYEDMSSFLDFCFSQLHGDVKNFVSGSFSHVKKLCWNLSKKELSDKIFFHEDEFSCPVESAYVSISMIRHEVIKSTRL